MGSWGGQPRRPPQTRRICSGVAQTGWPGRKAGQMLRSSWPWEELGPLRKGLGARRGQHWWSARCPQPESPRPYGGKTCPELEATHFLTSTRSVEIALKVTRVPISTRHIYVSDVCLLQSPAWGKHEIAAFSLLLMLGRGWLPSGMEGEPTREPKGPLETPLETGPEPSQPTCGLC